MITKNVKWGISENVTVAEFGSGDIAVSSGRSEEHPVGCVMLSNDEPKEIGGDIPERIGKTTNEVTYDVIMTFDNVDSVDVVINALQNARNRIIELNKKP